jgi:hypothetical protein
MDFDKFYSSLTPDERAYFIAVTDIFHDKPYNVIGRPSLSTQLQNTTVVNSERTLSIDDFPALAASPATSWDLNLTSLPVVTSFTIENATDSGYNIQPTSVPYNYRVGGITGWASDAGFDTWDPSINLDPPITMNADTFFFPDYTYLSAWTTPIKPVYYEVLSMGFEVYNVTPDLYKGGSVVRYRVPTQNRKASRYVELATATPPLTPTSPRSEYWCMPMPPANSQEATLYPDSIVADAKEGTYSMHTLQDGVSDYRLSGNDRFYFGPNANFTASSSGNCLVSASTFSPTYDYDCPSVRGDFDIVGAYFTGLPRETKLTVRYRIIVSTVPSPDNPQLLALAKVSPDANYKLNSLISHIQADFMPGVPVWMNPKGEWFKKVVSIGKKVIPKAIPIVKDLAQGNYLGAGEKAISEIKKATEKNERKQVTQEAKVSNHDKELAALLRRIGALESMLKGPTPARRK